MATLQHSHRSTGRRRRIGPIGTTARLIVGGLLLGSVVQGHLAGPFRPAAWALGLLGFPALLLGWQWLRARRTPTRLQATGPVANVLNVTFHDVEGESLHFALRGLAVSAGAACSSASEEASYVLRALGRSDQLAQSSLRLSLGRFTSDAEIDAAIDMIRREVPRLRGIARV